MQLNTGNPSLLGLTHLYSGDPSNSPNPMWAVQEKKDAINIAYEEMRELARLKNEGQTRKRSYTDLVDGQIFYSLPAEFVGRLGVEISGNGSNLSTAAVSAADIVILEPIGYDAALDAIAQNVLTEPKYSFVHGEHFGIAPPPGAALVGTNTVRITYEASTTHLSADGDEPEILRPYQYLIAVKASMLLRMSKDLDYEKLQNMWAVGIRLYQSATSERLADYEGSMAWAGATATRRSVNFGRVKKL